MIHAWSIRTRTALTFALTSMALAAAAITVVNLGSQASLSRVALERGVTEGTDAAPDGSAAMSPDTTPPEGGVGFSIADGDGAGSFAVVGVVAELQWHWSVLGVGGAGLLAGATGWLLSRRVLAPVDRISATARRLSASTLHERIALDGPDDELRRLSRTIDDLLDRLQAAFESQRRFVAQASHELRTPLAVQRAAIQIGLHEDADPDEVARAKADLLEQNRRTEHLVESLLVLAEAERGLGGHTTPVDLVDLVEAVVADAAGAAQCAGVTLTCRTEGEPPDRTVRAEALLVRQLLHNLVDNAVEYNVPDGFVRIVVDRDGIAVENSGPEIAPAVAAVLTEPFRRHGEAPHSGGRRHSGLGLSIVAAVTEAHGWALRVSARPGGGLTVRVQVRPDDRDGVSSM